MRFPNSLKYLICAAMLVTLAACQDSDERANGHFESAMSLLAEGDFARADVEFRNVFQHNGRHEDARANYAAMLRDLGDLRGSYSQYLRLVEQYPEHVQGRIALAEMALLLQNWDEARRHGPRAIELAPEDPSSVVIATNLAYLDALEEEDEAARLAIFEDLTTQFEADPDNAILRRVMIDGLVRAGERDQALDLLAPALEVEPDNRLLHDIRLQLLAEQERAPELEAALREMIDVFPEDENLPAMLLRFLVAQGDTDAALQFLRETAAAAGDDTVARHDALQALFQLRLEFDGPEAALAELDDIIASEGEDAPPFRILRAALNVQIGERQAAREELEALLESGISPGQAGQARVVIARILIAEGDIPQARALVEQVIEEDPGQVDALKMLAGWLIEEDDPDRAISRLRNALDAAPDDAEALTLMAEAHARTGNRQLARDFLSRAVEASNSAPEETIRYARVLLNDGREILAEELTIDALRLAPGDPDLLVLLGDIYLRMEDWSRAEQVERTLRDGDAASVALADRLRTAILGAQGQTEAALAYLEELAGSGEDVDLNTQIAVIRARLTTGDGVGALNYAQGLLEEDPENMALRLTLAAVYAANQQYAEAETTYRAVVTDQPDLQDAWIGLIRAQTVQGKAAEAQATLEEALAALPEAPDLLWAQASFRERLGDFEGAIALYEQLYAMLPNQPVVANNLASLISTYRDDEDSLDRAYAIARRLRGTEVPPFQDTYGWIAYRRGDFQEALEHLEPAAAALIGDALVQFHLGMTYLALGRQDEALQQLRRAVELAGPADSRPQFETARVEIAALEAAADQSAATTNDTDNDPVSAQD